MVQNAERRLLRDARQAGQGGQGVPAPNPHGAAAAANDGRPAGDSVCFNWQVVAALGSALLEQSGM